MNDELKKEDVQKLVDDLIDKLNSLSSKTNGKSVYSNGDIILEDDPGKWIKIDNKIFYQMIYTDVKKLKKDNEILLSQYLDDMKPTLKSVDENVKELGKVVSSVRTDVDFLMKNRPKTIKSWLSEQGQIAESTGNIFKFIFYTVVILYMLTTGLPAIFKFISQVIIGS